MYLKNMIIYIRLFVCVCAAVVCVCLTGCGERVTVTAVQNEDTTSTDADEIAQEASEADSAGSDVDGSSASDKQDSDMISVFVCGAVVNEGVYELPEDARKNAALDAAGGFAEDADTSSVNLADRVCDGEKIYFPREGETATEQSSAEGSESVLVNINTADISGLTELPGIGETRAERIVAYRQSHGSFSTKEELKNVSGIGDSIYEGLEDYITVE